MLDRNAVKPGDAIIGLASTGVHSNGFSLVRKIFGVGKQPDRHVDELGGASLYETLLTPTKIYVRPMLALMERVTVKSVSHITGGGFYENIPRSLPAGMDALIRVKSFPRPPVFDVIRREGNVPERDMYNTFNMGLGMTVIVPAAEADEAVRVLKENGQAAYLAGEIIEGEGGVRIE